MIRLSRRIWAFLLLLSVYSVFISIADIAFINKYALLLIHEFSISDISFFQNVAMAVGILMALIWGVLSDIASRKTILAVGVGGTGLIFIAAGAVDSTTAAIIVYILITVFRISIPIVALGYVGNIIHPEERAGAIGLVLATLTIGYPLGIVFSNDIYQWSPWIIYVPAIALILLVVPLLVFLVEPGKPGRIPTASGSLPNTPHKTPTPIRSILIMIVLAVTIIFLFFLTDTIFSLLSSDRLTNLTEILTTRMETTNFTLAACLGSVFEIVFLALLAGPLARYFGEAGAIVGGLLLILTGAATVALSLNPWVIMAGICIAGAGTGLVVPCVFTLVSRSFSSRRQGIAMGAVTAVKYLGIIASSYTGFLINGLFPNHPLGFVIVILVITLLIALVTGSLTRKNRTSAGPEWQRS